MSKGKKYSYQLLQQENSWSAKIIRQVTSRRTQVSKSKDGFETEEAATKWAQETLESFLEQQSERNKRKAEKREQRAESNDLGFEEE